MLPAPVREVGPVRLDLPLCDWRETRESEGSSMDAESDTQM